MTISKFIRRIVSNLLNVFVSERPNKTTLAAMKEAEASDSLETLDLTNFRNFVDSL